MSTKDGLMLPRVRGRLAAAAAFYGALKVEASTRGDVPADAVAAAQVAAEVVQERASSRVLLFDVDDVVDVAVERASDRALSGRVSEGFKRCVREAALQATLHALIAEDAGVAEQLAARLGGELVALVPRRRGEALAALDALSDVCRLERELVHVLKRQAAA